MGYAFLFLGDREQSIIPDTPAVGKDAWVRITSSAGETDAFTIDDGASFFGIEVRAPGHPSAKAIEGLKARAKFEVERGPMPAETWEVAEVKSKYLHLFHVIMEDLGRKFPDFKGMWRMSVREGDISEILDVIRKLSEANQQRAKKYTDANLPLSFVAKMMGGDAPSFAHYVRGQGAKIVTCAGLDQEFAAACNSAEEAGGKGAVLDFYTAWVAAEMGILDILKSWFGKLITPQSTIESIDRLIEHEEEGRGQRMMTVGWHNGQFVRQEITDDFIDQQVKALRTIKESILAHCEIARTILPNDLPELALKILDLIDGHALDPIYAARSEDMLLLSDDLRYRQVAHAIAEVPGIWLQAALSSALAGGVANRERVLQAYIGLAVRRHDHLRLDAGILLDIYNLTADDELRNFDAITDFIGSPSADIRSHTLVVYHFLSALWRAAKGNLRSQKATGMILGKLLRFRTADWHVWLGLLMLGTDIEIDQYIERWLRGHFLPAGLVVDVVRAWRAKFRRRRFGPISVLALLIARGI
jgi:cellulose synthase operon protein C